MDVNRRVAGHPHFFVDRSLGGMQVPSLLRSAGWDLTTLTEHYGPLPGEAVPDVEWLDLVGRRHWAVLMKDDKIRYRIAEISSLKSAGVHAFCIANGNLRAAEMAELFLAHEGEIFAICRTPGPTLHSITKTTFRDIEL